MSTEPELRDAMRQMLAPVSPSWVAAQVGVTRQQVDRWKNGHYVTAARVEAVAAAIAGLLPQTQKNAAPGIPARLDEIERKLDQVIATTSTLVETSPDLQDALRVLIGRIEGTQRPGGAAPLETDPAPGQVERWPEDREVG